MKTLIAAAVFTAAFPLAAFAQQNMTCADYLKADKQLQSQMGGAPPTTGNAALDAQAMALDKKVKDYCTKNPTVGVDKAMMEAMK